MSALQRVAPQEASGNPQGGGDERAPCNRVTSHLQTHVVPVQSLLFKSRPFPSLAGLIQPRANSSSLSLGVQAHVRDALLYPFICQQDVPARHVRGVGGEVEGRGISLGNFGVGETFWSGRGIGPIEGKLNPKQVLKLEAAAVGKI